MVDAAIAVAAMPMASPETNAADVALVRNCRMENGGKVPRDFVPRGRAPASDTDAKITENDLVDRASNLITGVLAKRGLARHALAAMAVHRVNGWLRERFPAAGAASVRTVADGVLAIECGHSIVLQELQLQLVELKAFCDAECRFASIREIRLSRSGEGPGNALAPGNPPA